jgi:hypothetical protein
MLDAKRVAAFVIDVFIPANVKAMDVESGPAMGPHRSTFKPECTILASLSSASSCAANPVYAAGDGVMPTVLRKPEKRREFHPFR